MNVAILIAVLAATQEPPPVAQGKIETVEDVVVVGTRQRQSPVDIFRALCFDANRLDGQAFRPEDVPGWAKREISGRLADDQAEDVYVRREGPVALVLRVREGVPDALPTVSRNSCSLTIAGDHDSSIVEREMAGWMGGRGTTDHLRGRSPDDPLAAWEQSAWFSIPDRSSRDWRPYMSERPPRPAFVSVVLENYYRRKKYVVTELRSGEIDGAPVSQLTLHVYYRRRG